MTEEDQPQMNTNKHDWEGTRGSGAGAQFQPFRGLHGAEAIGQQHPKRQIEDENEDEDEYLSWFVKFCTRDASLFPS